MVLDPPLRTTIDQVATIVANKRGQPEQWEDKVNVEASGEEYIQEEE
ncbi:hypothetical protein KDA23_05585 [Candidatus Saccharibacteria bacterium]|nr:hypothetical protein [Candidatus Saccharibacteria bacterium]